MGQCSLDGVPQRAMILRVQCLQSFNCSFVSFKTIAPLSLNPSMPKTIELMTTEGRVSSGVENLLGADVEIKLTSSHSNDVTSTPSSTLTCFETPAPSLPTLLGVVCNITINHPPGSLASPQPLNTSLIILPPQPRFNRPNTPPQSTKMGYPPPRRGFTFTAYWLIPLLSAVLWIAMILSLLIHWCASGRPHYASMQPTQTIASVSPPPLPALS